MLNKEPFAMFCKTYKNDFTSFENLFISFQKHNVQNIKLFVSIPKADFAVFKELFNREGINYLFDEDISDILINETFNGFSPGYINQQIIKLTFSQTGLAENYLCLDSDTYFIRDFKVRDFMFNESTPYTVLTDWEAPYWDSTRKHWIRLYNENIEKIKKEIDLDISHTITCSGLATISSKVIDDFFVNHLKKNSKTLLDCLLLCPYEFSWYNQWLLKTQLIPIYPVTGFFKVFHFEDEYNNFRKSLITKDDLTEKYVGIVMNSNWTKKSRSKEYEMYKGLFFLFLYYSKKIRLGIRRRLKEIL